jgi:hypothetical protein
LWCTIFNIYLIKSISSIFFTGCVIKLMDDYMDQDYDALINKCNVSNNLGHGVMPYVLLLFSIACVSNVTTAVSLFLASFGLGMVGTLPVKMPSGFSGYGESVAAIIAGLLLFGTKTMISSICIIAAVQLLDDYIDLDSDMISKKNLAFIFGKVECIVISIILFLCSVYFEPAKAVITMMLAPFIVYIIERLSKKLDVCNKMEEMPHVS